MPLRTIALYGIRTDSEEKAAIQKHIEGQLMDSLGPVEATQINYMAGDLVFMPTLPGGATKKIVSVGKDLTDRGLVLHTASQAFPGICFFERVGFLSETVGWLNGQQILVLE